MAGNLGTFVEAEHPRANDGKFAEKAGIPNAHIPSHKPLVMPKGKTPPPNWKFYKPGYKPKAWISIKGRNSKKDGSTLWSMKKSGAFANDYEFWLAAQKLAASNKKKHPNGDNASPNQIVNAAFRHELEETGDVKLGGNITADADSVKSDLGMPPVKPKKHVHAKTKSGIDITSKHAPPGALTTYVKQMPGATGSKLYKDDKGDEWLVKSPKTGSNAYSNSNFLVDLEHATALIQNKGGVRSANSHKTDLDGKKVLAQKMFGNVKVAFPGGPDISKMSDEDKLAMQKQQILDWMISNHDTHTGNFLKDEHGIVGIDKGQSFKFFGKDKLDWNYAPVSPLGSDKPTYQTMWKDYIDGKGDLFDFSNSPELAAFAARLESIDDDEYKDLLRPYAETAASEGKLSVVHPGVGPNMDSPDKVEVFLQLAVDRKNNLVNDFSDFYVKAHEAKSKKANEKPEQYADWEQDLLAKMKSDQPQAKAGIFDSLEVGDSIDYKGKKYKVTYKGATALLVGSDSGEDGKLTKAEINAEYAKAAEVDDLSGQKAQFYDIIPGDLITWQNSSGAKDYKVVNIGPNSVKTKIVDTDSYVIIGKSHFEAGNVTWTVPEYAKSAKAEPAKSEPKINAQFDYTFAGDIISDADGVNWSVVGKGPNTLSLKSLSDDHNKLVVDKDVNQNYFKGKSSVPQGYSVVPSPNNPGKFSIAKPNGSFASSATGVTKEWDSEADAIASSTMKKYATAPPVSNGYQPLNKVSLVGIDFTKPGDYPGITHQEFVDLQEMSSKHTQEPLQGQEFMDYKNLAQKIKNSKKAAGASQVVENLMSSFGAVFTPQTQEQALATPAKGKLPVPKFLKKGGEPPALASITGPNGVADGAALWERKKTGEFNSDDELWKAASKLSNQYKSKAQKENPGKKLVSGEDYSSPNQIRNAAMRHEFDETGAVKWETKEEMTSQAVTQTAGEAKATASIHDHVGKIPNPDHKPGGTGADLNVWTDKSKPVGSYENPHAFYDQAALRKYGAKYTSHASWPPEQYAAWRDFTGSSSGSINTFFRVGETGFTAGNLESIKKQCKNLVAAFKNSNNKPLDDWTVVTRGTGGGWELGIGSDVATFEDMKAQEGKIVRNKCPVSTSLHVNPAFSSHNVHIVYKLPPGFRGLFAGGKSKVSGENEWIMPPGMAYKILEVKQASGKTKVLVEVVDVTLPEID